MSAAKVGASKLYKWDRLEDLKSHPKDYHQKLTYNHGHPSKYKPRAMLLNPSKLGG